MHCVGGTGEGAQHPFGVLHTVGLAEHFAVHVHHGVAAEHHGARVLRRDGKALAPGQFFHQLGRRVGGDGAFVKVAGADGEIGGV